MTFASQVRIMFEVQDLKFATLATVSRCGMVWFSEDILSGEMIFENYLMKLRQVSLEDADEDVSVYSRMTTSTTTAAAVPGESQEEDISPSLQVCDFAVNDFFSGGGAIGWARMLRSIHKKRAASTVMPPAPERARMSAHRYR